MIIIRQTTLRLNRRVLVQFCSGFCCHGYPTSCEAVYVVFVEMADEYAKLVAKTSLEKRFRLRGPVTLSPLNKTTNSGTMEQTDLYSVEQEKQGTRSILNLFGDLLLKQLKILQSIRNQRR